MAQELQIKTLQRFLMIQSSPPHRLSLEKYAKNAGVLDMSK